MSAASATAPTVLVVDDDPATLRLVNRILGGCGFRVILANSGVDALPTLELERVDVALIDVCMPHVDGRQLLDRIQRSFPGVEVILMSGLGDIEQATFAMKAGARDFLQKPFKTPAAVVDAVREALAR